MSQLVEFVCFNEKRLTSSGFDLSFQHFKVENVTAGEIGFTLEGPSSSTPCGFKLSKNEEIALFSLAERSVPQTSCLPQAKMNSRRGNVRWSIACIRQNGLSGCTHRCQKWPLHASFSAMTLAWIRFQVTKTQHLDPNIRNFVFHYRGFTTEDGPDRFRLHEEWFGSIVYPLIDMLHEEWFGSIVYPLIDKGWIMESYGCCENPVVKTNVADVCTQMLVLGESENGCTQGSVLKRMHARVFWGTDVRIQKDHFDGCTQRTFGQQIRTRYEANPRCAQPKSRCGWPL